MILLAQTTTGVPWGVTSHWLFGLIGALGVAWLMLGIANQSRKVFGKRPPLYEELGTLRTELTEADCLLARKLEMEHKELDVRLAEIQTLHLREQRVLHRKINGIARSVYLICGRMKITPASNPDEDEL